jgi:Xaa-Pro aminopeptidase
MAHAVSAEEFQQRRDRAVALARKAGFDGLLVCSRGGNTLDRYADVAYLSNHYTQFPFIPDYAGSWSARAHTFLVLPVDGRPTLVIDVPNDGRIRMGDGTVTYTDLVVESTIDALRTSGLAKARLGLVGTDVLAHPWAAAIAAALPDLRLEPADGLVGGLRSVKSPAEIEALRRASELGSRMIETMLAAARPGVSHGEIVAAGLQVLVPAGGMLYSSFMASGRGGDAPKIVKCNFPTWGSQERLESGDWIRFGISGMLDGYLFDLSRAKAVGPVSKRQVETFEAALATVEAAYQAIRPGATAHDLAEAGLGKQVALGFPIKGVFSAMGHGIGLGWDEPWLARGETREIVPGMVLCLERTVSKDGYLGDMEETVVVTATGAEKITSAPLRHW